MVEKKRSVGITVFGWLLIIYFFYCEIIPLVWGLVTMGIREPSSGPLGIFRILNRPMPSIALMKIYTVNGFIQPFLHIGSLIGGIGLLRFRRWSRKFVVVIFSFCIVSALIQLFITLSHNFFWKYSFPRKIDFLFFWLFLGFYIVIVTFFTRPKVKEQFRPTLEKRG